jgi:hypothetical protein
MMIKTHNDGLNAELIINETFDDIEPEIIETLAASANVDGEIFISIENHMPENDIDAEEALKSLTPDEAVILGEFLIRYGTQLRRWRSTGRCNDA